VIFILHNNILTSTGLKSKLKNPQRFCLRGLYVLKKL
jgi:hypothetical protein